MGQFATGDVNIFFTREEDATKVYHMLKESPEASFNKFLGEEKGAGHYEFHGFSDNGGHEVYFEFSSGRVQNAEWQMDQVVKLLKALVKAGEVKGIEEFNTSMMVDSGIGIYMEGDEFNEEDDEQ